MKLYNPFKPHIVKFKNGKFAIRQFKMLWGWEFLDNNIISIHENYWWTFNTEIAQYYIEFSTLEEVEKRLSSYNNRDGMGEEI